jgi:DNA-binding transcriptional regulator LsrR (DeoR family)
MPKSDPKRLEMIADVARLYYEENINVKAIATLFETSPSSVSRLVIHYPFLTVPSLGEQLRQHLALKDAYVLPDFRGPYPELMQRLGQLAARVLEERLDEGLTLGVSQGLAVACTARAFTMTRGIHCTVVRLHGASDHEIEEGNNLAQIFSAQLGGQFKLIPSPLFMQSRSSRDLILEEPSVQDMIRQAEGADVALVGLGAMDPALSTLVRNRLLSAGELAALRKAGAVGEVCGKYYDAQGRPLDTEINHRTVSIDIGRLRCMDQVLGVAAGAGKVEAILGAVRGGLVNVLVTHAETARLLLKAPASKPIAEP